MGDWENHLTTIFPDVRLKRYLEMRGADGGPWRLICALPALWVGLLYDAQAQAEAADLISGWSADEREYLRSEVGGGEGGVGEALRDGGPGARRPGAGGCWPAAGRLVSGRVCPSPIPHPLAHTPLPP